ncbi:unnamed protein product [Withania somnifera]
MPGTIQVSVFDFKNISSSSICLWVSMGKKAYQTWDKGDFSFPLTTFRENLVVRFEDVEGKEISRTEVEILSIVEKGYWDDIFQLEGGYHVHMKLQFILNEDERNRIRNVRESALKKKQDKLTATNVKFKEIVRDTFASSLPIRRVFSDRNEANSSEGIEIQYSESDRPSAKKLQTQLLHDYIDVKPIYDQDAQSILKMDVTGKEQSMSQQKILSDPSNKPEDQSAESMLRIDVAAKKESVSQEKMDVAVKKASASQKKIVDSSNEVEDQGGFEKTPSNVRKMISAFEIDLTQKGRRSLTRTRASKSQPNLVGTGGFIKDLDPENTSMPNKMSTLRLERSFNFVELPEPQKDIGKRVDTEQPVFHEQLIQAGVHIVPFNEAGSSQQGTFESAKNESGLVAASPVDLMRLTNLQTATSSQTTSVDHPDMLKTNNLAADRDCFTSPSVAEKRNREINSETLPEVHFERASNVKPNSTAYCKNELYDSENSGAWIFPDSKRHLCMTSAGKNIVHLSEDCRVGVEDHQRNKRPCMQEITVKRGFFHTSDSMTKKESEKPQKSRDQSESSGENGSSGPIRQVVKIALIVGFGILVLFTRQRETRSNDRKSKDFYLTRPDVMDQLASSEEQWSLLTVQGD